MFELDSCCPYCKGRFCSSEGGPPCKCEEHAQETLDAMELLLELWMEEERRFIEAMGAEELAKRNLN